MSAKRTLFVFALVMLGLGIIALVIFIDREPAPEPFLCNGQPCNIILIIPETLSARHMGIYGYERDTTPFIDEFFSEESLVFESAWSNAPWTLPSFAALFTSQLAADVFVETRRDKLSARIPTFIDVLDKNETPKFAAHTATVLLRPNLDSNLITRFKPEERFKGADPLLFLKAAEWIEARAEKDDGQPFFLFIQPFAPHDPYDPPEPYRYFFDAPEEYPGPATVEEIIKAATVLQQGADVETEIERFRLQYDQEIRYIDSELESFIARIPEDVLQNTIFIFTSDRGEAFGQHGSLLHGIYAYAGTPYEEEIHVPFLMRAPGIEQKRIKEPVTLLDLGPTILEIFSLKSPRTFRGVSLVSVLRGKELQLEDRIVRAEHVHHRSLSPRDWENVKQQVRTNPLSDRRDIAVRKGNRKLLQLGDGFLELYNLEQDYYE